jgi:hypothetical protein
VPNPPTLSATVSGTSVSLAWQAGAAGPATTFYQLRAGSAPGLSNLAILNLPASTLVFNTTASPGTYYVRVAVGNATGVSFPSNEVTVTTAALCTPTTPSPADRDRRSGHSQSALVSAHGPGGNRLPA